MTNFEPLEIGELERAGLYIDDQGNPLKRPVSTGAWLGPNSIWLDKTKQWILWGYMPITQGLPWMDYRYPSAEMLVDFIRLAEAPPENFIKFAYVWGVLMRCEHGLKIGLAQDSICDQCQPYFSNHSQEDGPPMREPISLWREYAVEMGAILNLAALLHQEKRGSKTDWEKIKHRIPDYYKNGDFKSIEREQFVLGRVIVNWANFAGVQIVFNWGLWKQPSITLGGNLLAVLVIQLMLTVGRVEGMGFCSSCGLIFLPKRQLRSDQSNYCTDCGIHAAWKKASQKYRDAQKKKKKKPHQQNKEVKVIV